MRSTTSARFSLPTEAQEGHDQVLAALEDFSSKLTDVSDAADSGDKTALQDAATALQEAGLDFQTQLTEAAASLEDAGVSLGGSSATPVHRLDRSERRLI